MADLRRNLEMLRVECRYRVVTGDDVPFPKPDPHLFACRRRGARGGPAVAVIVAESTWDMLAARGAGALGYSTDLLKHLDGWGLRTEGDGAVAVGNVRPKHR
jgi:phosphoglycolate phosphatase-like HAD superfamily hydrolase